VTGPTSRTAAGEWSESSTHSVEPTARETTPPRRRGRRLLLVCMGMVVVLIVVLVLATLRLFVFPSADQPRYVNGIVSFDGSNEGARAAAAVSLAEKGYAHVLLFSQGGDSADTSCPKVPRVAVVCFVDVTDNTRGEAEWAGRYAERHHWHSVLIVPGRAQATRARLLMERCFSGQIVVVPASEPRPPVSEIIHEWGGVLDALFIHRGC
jgi:uncharacterized SAM-binding protein YcdF (DUF218 family)